MTTRALLILAIVALAVAQPVGAVAQDDDPGQMVARSIEQALAVLRDTDLGRPERLRRIRQVADAVFDWSDMARRSLGVHWRKLDDAQRTRFVTVFQDLLASQYRDDLDRFRGDEQVSVDASEASGDDWVVRTTLVTHSRERVPIHYYLHRGPKGWRVHDVSIEGVSLVNHFRKRFTRYLVNHTFDDLMKVLERKRAALRH